MDAKNQTNVMNFILLGLSDHPDHQTALFMLFLVMYLVGLISNSSIMAAITSDPQLHTPMYFFIGNLSLVDIIIMTVVVPQLLVNSISQRKTIHFSHCITQLYFFLSMGGINLLLLGAMAYDRYVAICNPLHYLMVMDIKVCSQLVAASWIVGLLNSLLHSMMIARLSFCASNLIESFFCDIPPLLKVSCSDTSVNELLLLTESLSVILVSVLSIVASYARIIIALLNINSSEGRRKAFSTCSSHLIVVSLYYGTILFSYIRPTSSYSLEKNKGISVMYTVVTPMLNPFIYSLRNGQMKQALRKALRRCLGCNKF
ncbi:olfactory receptor 1f45-like [Pleurodeles waltl]|uniref:olfactory receptor 1f45-like n=1 Tax=Pleurodeles waltl TaxID=8319 RepID=UPI003709A2CB